MLTPSQKITNYETLKHIELVMQYLGAMQHELQKRMFSHDRSKLETPEMEMFEQFTDSLAGVTYGSDEYNQGLEEMKKTALGHHYENNRHHPQFFVNGVDDMNLIDILEMTCDWLAACKRHHDGDPWKSLEINKTRFNLSPQLALIMGNTIRLMHNKPLPFEGLKSQKNL